MSPVQALRTDLRRAGVQIKERIAVCAAYRAALTVRTDRAWEDFYGAVYRELTRLQPAAADDALAIDARLSLRRIVEDDLGARLFPPVASEPDFSTNEGSARRDTPTRRRKQPHPHGGRRAVGPAATALSCGSSYPWNVSILGTFDERTVKVSGD